MTVTKATVAEHSAAVILARVVGADGDPVVPADVSAVAVRVFDLDTGTEVLTEDDADPAVADVLYATLRTDARWAADATGYNLAIPVRPAQLPDGPRTYRVEVKITPVEGDAYYVLAELDTIRILGE